MIDERDTVYQEYDDEDEVYLLVPAPGQTEEELGDELIDELVASIWGDDVEE